MAVTEEPATRRTVLRALLLIGAAGGIGGLVVPAGFTSFLVGAWAGGFWPAVGVAVVTIVVVPAMLVGVASLVPQASAVTRTMSGRVAWALIVTFAGSILWFFAFLVYAETSDLDPIMRLPLSAVPYAVVAGLSMRRWYFTVGSVVLAVVSVVVPLASLAGTVPDELDARLAAANLDREQVFIAQVPGFHPVPQRTSWVLAPDDPEPVAPYVSLYAYLDDPTGDCQVDPHNSELAGAPCTVEQPGLTYSLGVVHHGYAYRTGPVLLMIVGTLAVDRMVLRAAILTARPTTEPGIYTTDIAGFTAEKQGIPPGTQFLSQDRTRRAGARHVEVSASRVPHAQECAEFQQSGAPSLYLECVDERPDLHYRRLRDNHSYLVQHGPVEVQVFGGLGVDRDLLRDAALSARPATDEELMSMLPPAPSVGGLKGFAKRLFG